MRILRREAHGVSRAVLGSHKDRMKHAGPIFVDPITMGEFEVSAGRDDTRLGAGSDPLLLCEVGCDLGLGRPTHGPVDNDSGPLKPAGLQDMIVPISGKEGDLFSLDKVVVAGQGLVCGLSDVTHSLGTSKEMENSEEAVCEADLVIGPTYGPLSKGDKKNLGISFSFCSNRTGVPELEKVDFSDESVLPNLTPPGGFSWEFIAGGWALRSNVGQSDMTVGGTHMSSVNLHSPTPVMTSTDSTEVSDDSFSEFERNLQELLPGLPRGSETGDGGQPCITSKSE